MGIEWLSGSIFPDALALLCSLTVAIAMLLNRKRHPRLCWATLALAVIMLAAVLGKFVASSTLISSPLSSHDVSDLHGYAKVLAVIAVIQLLVGIGFLVSSPVPKVIDWMANATAITCFYATTCTLDWRNVYLSQDPGLPLHYAAFTPILHWLFVLMLVGFIGMTVKHGSKRRKSTE